MKKVLTNFMTLGGISLLLLASCKKNDPVVKISGNGTAGTLAANQTTLVLDKSKASDTSKVIMFNFTKPVYGYSAAVTNTLQIDAPGDNWAHPATTTLGVKVASQGFSTPDFNALLLKLNLPADVASQVQVRVQHSLGAGAEPIYSNVLNMTVTPFNLKAWVYLPGAYEGWANDADPTKAPNEDSLYSATGNGIYVGVVNFTAGNREFLIVPIKGKWDNKWATTDGATTSATNASYTTEYVTGGGNNFQAPTAAGQYLLTFNSNTGNLTIQPVNYYTIIGDGAVDWGTDIPMKYINDGSTTWTATTVMKTSGSIKVRQNSDWTYSWGIPQAGSPGDGVANTLNDSKDDNIPVPSNGSHTLTFTIPLTAQAPGFTPSVTATYTLK